MTTIEDKLIQEVDYKITAQKDYVSFLQKYLSDNPDALCWVLMYSTYVHKIDDVIDGDKENVRSKEFILKTFEDAAVVYSHPFYQQWKHLLYGLIVMASNTYMDSVLLEFSTTADDKPWKKNTQDYLRQTGNELILMCIEIVGGYENRRKASLELRDISWRNHHKNITGEPV